MKKKLLIIENNVFGGCTDLYYWCRYLREDYDIKIVCLRAAKEQRTMDGISLILANAKYPKLVRMIQFVWLALWNIFWFKGKIWVMHFNHCEIFKYLLPYKQMHLDIRSLAVCQDYELRQKVNNQIKYAANLYDTVSTISEGVARQLGNIGKPISVLPLGADCISLAKKSYEDIHLLYVGTFTNRDLHKTIEGVSLYHKSYPDRTIVYDIIGSGLNDELEQLKALSTQLGLDSVITFHGRIPNQKLMPYFDQANVGVSFVPITEYYQDQPPTKTFEYAMSGLFTIATATNENKKYINSDNGILIEDTPEEFAQAIEVVYANRAKIDEAKIRASLKEYTWDKIVNKRLKTILDSI